MRRWAKIRPPALLVCAMLGVSRQDLTLSGEGFYNTS